MFNFETQTTSDGSREVVIDKGLIKMMSDLIKASITAQVEEQTQINLSSESAREQLSTRAAKDLVYGLVNAASEAGIAAVSAPPSAASVAARKYKSNS